MDEPAKSWWQSKMIWLNVGTAAVAILGTLITTPGEGGGPLLPVSWLPYLSTIVSVINVLLRINTTQALK